MEFLRLLASIRTPFFDTLMAGVTYFGSEVAFMAAALLLFWCVDKKQGYYVFLVGAFGTVCNQFLKLACRVPRPWVLDPEFQIVEAARADATGYSFPSGHTQNIVGTTASVFACRREKWVRAVCVALMLLVPFSRMYLGVHTPLDVSVGFVTALALAAALYPAFRSEQAAKKATPWILLYASSLSSFSSLARCDRPASIEDLANITHGLKNAYTMAGAVLGFIVVYLADEKKLHFEVRAPLLGQILKLVLGLGLIIGIKAGLKPVLAALFAGSQPLTVAIFAGAQAESLVRYFIIVIFAGIVWPLTFPFFAKLGAKGKRA
mgnify:CR=1 FL=1